MTADESSKFECRKKKYVKKNWQQILARSIFFLSFKSSFWKKSANVRNRYLLINKMNVAKPLD